MIITSVIEYWQRSINAYLHKIALQVRMRLISPHVEGFSNVHSQKVQ
jgi:uncharacterized protein Usg